VESIEVLVGRIGRPHGIRGEVTIDVRTDEPDRRFITGAELRAEAPRGAGAHASLRVSRARWHQQTLLLTFEEINSRDGAEAARGLLLYADRPVDEVPQDPEEFYDTQLIGLRARDLDGTDLGEIEAVRHGAAQDLLVIRTLDGRETYVPFVSALVPDVDVAGGHVTIADRPGLVAPAQDD
jgi:16S rRNA processing protein RimM